MTRSPPSGGRGGPARPVRDLLGSDGDAALQRVLAHARDLARLDRVVRSLLDDDTARHARVADLRDGRLTLVVPTAAWATRLRMQSVQLVRRLDEAGLDSVRSLDVRVAPLPSDAPEPRQRRHLSAAARHALRRFASISGDADIQAIVDRLDLPGDAEE